MLRHQNMQIWKMKVKRTFFNSRNGRLFENYEDTNNYLLIIFFDSGAELSFVLRDLKKNDSIVNYIYKKLNIIFGNIAEIETTKISLTEYNLMRHYKVPHFIKIC